MRKIIMFVFLCLIGLYVLGCVSEGEIFAHQPNNDSSIQEKQIVLYCGAGIRKPTEQIARAFEAETGLNVDCRFGGSGKMFRQLAKAKDGDLYMAGTYYVDKAEKDNLVIATRSVCCVRPVILVSKGNPKHISSVHDLARPDMSIYFADPLKCQSGIVSETVLTKNNVDMKGIKANLVRPLPEGEKLINLIQEGHLDAAIVWDAQASRWIGKADTVSIPEKYNEIWPVRVALLTFAEHQDHARRFMEILTSKQGKAIFKKHHFICD